MKFSILFSSHTGNTRLLAETLKNTLPDSECIYYGLPDQQALEADLICIGFWTDKGCCDEALSAFLKTVHHKQIFLFGTAGFGRSDEYFSRILTNVTNLLEPDNTLVGQFICQGKMPITVRKRYESMLDQEPEKFQSLIDNFDQGQTHPDNNDLNNFKAIAEAMWKKVNSHA